MLVSTTLPLRKATARTLNTGFRVIPPPTKTLGGSACWDWNSRSAGAQPSRDACFGSGNAVKGSERQWRDHRLCCVLQCPTKVGSRHASGHRAGQRNRGSRAGAGRAGGGRLQCGCTSLLRLKPPLRAQTVAVGMAHPSRRRRRCRSQPLCSTGRPSSPRPCPSLHQQQLDIKKHRTSSSSPKAKKELVHTHANRRRPEPASSRRKTGRSSAGSAGGRGTLRL